MQTCSFMDWHCCTSATGKDSRMRIPVAPHPFREFAARFTERSHTLTAK